MQKIKSFIESEKGKDIMIVIIVILVGICSFYLGRLSSEKSSNGLKIENRAQEAGVIESLNTINSTKNEQIMLNPSISERINNNVEGNYFASKRGKKYYSNACSAGKSIKKENRIYFNSSNEAEAAGYVLASSC